MKKLDAVTYSLEKVASGDLKIAELEITSNDEIGILSHGLNEMKSKLRNLLTNIANSSEQVAASSEELTASTSQVSETTEQAAKNAVDMTEGATKQAQTIVDLRKIIDEMREKMHELHANAGTMNELSRISHESAIDGKEKVEFAVKQIKSIAEQVNKSA